MVNLAEIPQWVIALIGVIVGLLIYRLTAAMHMRRFPKLPQELKIKCPVCGGTNLERVKETGPNYIEYKCLKCGEIFYPNQ